jgi:hypothetical protein
MHALHGRVDHLVGYACFWVWVFVGFAIAIGLVSLGVLTLAPAALVAIALLFSPRAQRSAFGLVSGAGALGLLVAGLQRGAGNLDARPWFLAGPVLAAVGIAGHAWRRD